MRVASRLGWIALLGLVFADPGGAKARADFIFFKDGYVLQGSVRRETKAEFDHVSKEFFHVPKGFFMIDDGPRRIYFSFKQVRLVEKMAAPIDERVVSRKRAYILVNQPMPPIHRVIDVGPWNYETWRRDYFFGSEPPDGSPERKVRLFQGLAGITPYFAHVDAVTKYPWASAYLTREWDPETVYKLLLHNPDLMDPVMRKPGARPRAAVKAKRGAKDTPGEKISAEEQARRDEITRVGMIAARRMRMCDFFAQAGWFDIAERELDRLIKDLPEQKERVKRARLTIDKLRARDLWEQTKNWYQAGRYDAVGKRLAKFPTNNVPDRIQADIREMKERLASSTALMTEAVAALAACSKEARANNTANGRSLAGAIDILRTELHPDTVGRLDAFLGQVRDAARQKARGKKPAQSPENLLSLAVSGWLLGSPSAEAAPDVAVSLWKTRQMVLTYLQESSSVERNKLLATYQRTVTPTIHIDEIAQLIDHLPPTDPVKILDGVTVQRKPGGRRGSTYYLRLPPEYTPGRQYPVVILLTNTGETPKEVIDRWSALAADHGYILAAPDRGLADKYGFSAEEHNLVTDTLRDLRRCFGVDSDRVFLHGVGIGALMAFDVGLAHPDLFAGVLPMGLGPIKYPKRYWRNAQYLPFYVVSGTRSGDASKNLRDQFDNWILRSFPTLWVEYKGRGIEWFGGELPNMFDWMRNQRRAFPLRQIGTDGFGGNFGNEFCTMRPGDDRFYWLTSSSINARNTIDPADRWTSLRSPATLTGQIDPQTNHISLKTSGLSQVTIWLGRNPRGQYMVDFDKPISVRVGFRYFVNKRRMQPNLSVLMEDLYQRGDRKHLFVACIDIDLRGGIVKVNSLDR